MAGEKLSFDNISTSKNPWVNLTTRHFPGPSGSTHRASSHQPQQVGTDDPLTQKDQGDAYSQAFGTRIQESPISQVAETLAS